MEFSITKPCSVKLTRFQLEPHLDADGANSTGHHTAAEIITKTDLDALEDTQFQCYFCDFRWNSRRSLTIHENNHRRKRFYQPRAKFCCDICFKSFKIKLSLRTHELTHMGEKPFACDHCDYRSTQKSNLNTHLKSHHSERKTYNCHVCAVKLAHRSGLKTHMKLHKEELKHECTGLDEMLILIS